MSKSRVTDADDMFADTRMSFGDHIEELRFHLWRAVIGFFAIITICLILDGIGWATDSDFGVGLPVMKYMAKPVEDALQDYYKKRVKKIAEELKQGKRNLRELNEPKEISIQLDINTLKAQLEGKEVPKDAPPQYVTVPAKVEALDWALKMSDAEQIVTRPARLSTLNVTEAMVIYFKVAIVCGIVISSPWVFWQLWSFIAAGLYPHEKRYVNLYLPFSLGLFLAGVVVCEVFVLPNSVAALLFFNEWLDLEPNLRLEEWLSFAIWLPVIFGVAFQTPLVMMFLNRIGIVDVDFFKRKRRIAWFALAVFAAFITPTPDAVTMLCMWVPMCLLYELGIFLCKLSPQHESDLDVPEPEELVEV